MKNGRTLKRVLSLLLCVLMFASLLPSFAFADLAAPTLISASADGNAILVTWNEVSGAASYKIYRKSSGSDWAGLATTSATSYRDSSASAGVTYTYTVRCLDASNKICSSFDTKGVSGSWKQADAGWLSTPQLTSAAAEGNAIRVKWNEVAGANGYRIYRKTTGDWSFLADVGQTGEYLDSSVSTNVKYTYTVRCLNNSGMLCSDFNKSGISGTVSASDPQLSAPELVSAVASGNGILVTWNAVSGAASYKIYRKEAGKDWAGIANSATNSYTDTTAAPGKTYTYTVRCLNSSGKVCSSFNTIGVSGAWTKATAGYIATPTLVSAKVDGNSIVVKWKSVGDAAGYRIYRKAGSGDWQFLTDVFDGTVEEYTDTSASANVTYAYTVRCLNSSNKLCSDYNKTGVSARISAATASQLSTPKLIGAAAEGSGLRVTWEAVSGASGYRVYRKSGSSDWSFLVDVNGGATTSYLDNTASAGTRYSYTVRCLNSSGKLCSSFDTTGVSGSWTANNTGNLATPVLDKVVPKVDGVEFSWNAVSGADGYKIYRRMNGGGWVGIGTTTESKYLDTSVQNNTQYTYTVRCLTSGKVSSGFDANGKTIQYFQTPELLEATNSDTGILVSWKAVSGAPKYLLYRKTASGNWTELAAMTATSYQDNTADPGTEYFYTVRVIPASGNVPYKSAFYLSDYDHAGISATFVGKAQVSKLTNKVDGVLVEWKTVTGVANYFVYRKSNSGEFIKIGESATTSYTDTTAASNTTYTYMIRGVDSSNVFFGSYDAEGMSITFYAAPTLVDAVREKNGILVTWEEVEGLKTFIVYRKIGSGAWKELTKKATGTSYLDTTVVSGVDATYTVRGVSADGETLLSDYDHIGVTCQSQTFFDAPVLVSAASDIDGILVRWNAVDGVSKYRVFRADNTKTSWEQIGDTTDTFYLDPDIASGGVVKNGATYTYTVACLDSSDQLASEYDSTGMSAIYYTVPVMVSAKNAVGGVQVTWEAADGIGSYAIYRKTGSQSWTQIAAGVSGTSYIDSTAQSAGHYAYAVSSMINGKVVSAHEVPGVDTTFYAAPAMNSATNVENGVRVTWESVDGINEYRLYRKTGSSEWTFLADISGDTKYEDTTAVSGYQYSYTARCMDGSSTICSDFERTGVSIRYIAAPTLVSATGSSKSIKVTWQAVDGATSYLVYRRTATSNWEYIATVNGGGATTYTNTGLTSGYTYYYTIMARDANGVRSSYNSTGVSATTK